METEYSIRTAYEDFGDVFPDAVIHFDNFSRFVLMFVLFLAVWVVFPIVFMLAISLQRFFIFMNVDVPSNPQFNNPENYGIDGVINFYITTMDRDNSTLVLADTKKPVLLYMHGVACTRIVPTLTYNVIRKYFLVIGMDHRGYGDSGTNVLPSELGIVNDNIQLYKWVRAKTNNQIYVWGHSLGGALAIHSVRALKDENIVPVGLFLESTFSTMRDEINTHILGKTQKILRFNAVLTMTWIRTLTMTWSHMKVIVEVIVLESHIKFTDTGQLKQGVMSPATEGKASNPGQLMQGVMSPATEGKGRDPGQLRQIFKWLAYFEQTVLEPLEKNGFLFRSTTNILYVDCPIMIMHAQDDNVVHYTLGRKLYEVASTERDLTTQGNVTFHEFEEMGYKHVYITSDPNIPKYIEEFMEVCERENKGKG
ncbi:hypothetical protein NQ318_013305 [Aromia moschata]|uniref:Serine aminopeptidase S33 domain-containing protein n=1 Tax=Aromia moschata TaxID=1265417 RepID=A0AAV8XYC8_9CUCU|nr:hypothetical protein NQ318_013305 [Aromia moschata]